MSKNSNRTNKPQTAQPQISRNVNTYQHFFKKSNLNEDNIIWATNLRTISLKNSNNISESAPECFYKTTISFQNKLKNMKSYTHQSEKPSLNYANYEHLMRRRLDKGTSVEKINFQIGLRNRTENSNSLQKNKFNIFPVNSRRGSSTQKFLRKGSMKKLKFFQDNDYQETFDGYNKYPAYSQKILKEKNFNNYQHLSKHRGHNLPTLAWQIGLRKY